MPCRMGPAQGRKTVHCVTLVLLHTLEVHLDEPLHVNLDCDNVMDLHGNLKVWEILRSTEGKRTDEYRIYRGRGKDGGVTGRIGCSFFVLALISMLMTSRFMALDTRTWN